jgi:SnoaL-like protein
VDLVRSILASWERDDYASVEWAHPEIEYVIAGGPSPGSLKGLSAMAEAWREFLSAREDLHIKADEYCEVDDERVLVLLRSSGGGGKTSGEERWIAPLGVAPGWPVRLHETRHDAQTHSGRGAALFHVRSGKVTKLIIYWNRDRAFADVGLSPEAG